MARPKGSGTKEPTNKEKERVEKLAGYGLTHEQICNILQITRPTLVKWYDKELKAGKDVAIELVLDSLFYNIKKGKEASIIFYCKTRLGWKETTAIELVPPPGFKFEEQDS